MVDSCRERHKLAHDVVKTMNQMYAAKRDLEAARKNNGASFGERWASLQEARAKARDAQRAFNQHTTAHANCL